MKNIMVRIALVAVLVMALSVGFATSFSDTASAAKPDGGGKYQETGGPNLFWD